MKNKRWCVYISLLIIAIMVSGCDLYNQIYTEEEGSDGVTFVPIEDIVVEDEKDSDVGVQPSEGMEELENDPDSEVVDTTEELFPPRDDVLEDVSEDSTETIASEDAIVVISQETDFISLEPDASDPDNDDLAFFYTEPLDDDGTWQTTYGDAGEYTLTLTASDGTLSSSQDVLLIVNKKEEAPTIDNINPGEEEVTSSEDTVLDFSITANDLNSDPLDIIWMLDGEEVSDDNEFIWEVGYTEAGSHTLVVEVTDGTTITSEQWNIVIANVNRAPLLDDISDITIDETETVRINPSAVDPDGDDIVFSISEPVGDAGVWETTYDDAGDYIIEVSAYDGEDTVSTEVNVKVNNVNRPPVISGIIRK